MVLIVIILVISLLSIYFSLSEKFLGFSSINILSDDDLKKLRKARIASLYAKRIRCKGNAKEHNIEVPLLSNTQFSTSPFT